MRRRRRKSANKLVHSKAYSLNFEKAIFVITYWRESKTTILISNYKSYIIIIITLFTKQNITNFGIYIFNIKVKIPRKGGENVVLSSRWLAV